jgi:shikimate dehydrogenase
MRTLTGQARLAGVIGWPVGHSRSPRLHNFWLARHRIDGAYVPLPVRPDSLADAVRGLRACGFAGANVTIPHKETAFALCTEVQPFARRAGAVNTLIFRDGQTIGLNTDGPGFMQNLLWYGVDPARGPALVLGAGGAARAIVTALHDVGVHVTVANRTPDHAAHLAQSLPGLRVLPWRDWPAAAADHALLVNTTSLGMSGHPPLDIDLSRASPTLVVADIVYVPLTTKLLAAAAAAGLRTVPGLGMLLHQARPGFAAWFGVKPAVDAELLAFMADGLPQE